MVNLRQPSAGGRVCLVPTTDGDYTAKRLPLEDPLEGATESERKFYLAHYDGIPLAELLRRLRAAEWSAAHYKAEYEGLQETARRMPPLYKIQERDARHRRVLALLKASPRRRVIPKAELEEALYGFDPNDTV
jgi:hypothetical protein